MNTICRVTASLQLGIGHVTPLNPKRLLALAAYNNASFLLRTGCQITMEPLNNVTEDAVNGH